MSLAAPKDAANRRTFRLAVETSERPKAGFLLLLLIVDDPPASDWGLGICQRKRRHLLT